MINFIFGQFVEKLFISLIIIAILTLISVIPLNQCLIAGGCSFLLLTIFTN